MILFHYIAVSLADRVCEACDRDLPGALKRPASGKTPIMKKQIG
jgi:hypothetical protein